MWWVSAATVTLNGPKARPFVSAPTGLARSSRLRPRVWTWLRGSTLHAHDVPHYWVVDPEQETLIILRHGPDGYVNILSAGVGDASFALSRSTQSKWTSLR
jgi:hypothetical protein